jgi:hypothetical protein
LFKAAIFDQMGGVAMPEQRGGLGGFLRSLFAKEPVAAAREVGSGAQAYPLGIVGERNYQPAIRRCREGAPVTLMLEPDNPYDADAVVVVSQHGQTIGYLARDCWMREAILTEGKGCSARIKGIQRGEKGPLGVVLEAIPGGPPLLTRSFMRG